MMSSATRRALQLKARRPLVLFYEVEKQTQ